MSRYEHVIDLVTTLPYPRETVFPFFAEAANLEAITPPELRFRIRTPLPIEMREGARIEYRLSLFGVPFGWTTEITRWDPPYSFVDEQIRGPFRLWRHEHVFADAAEGKETRMRDRVDYALPFAPFGELVHPIVASRLDRIFSFRRDEIARRFAAREWAERA